MYYNAEGDEAKAPSLLCAMHPARLGYQCNDGTSKAWIPAYHVSAGICNLCLRYRSIISIARSFAKTPPKKGSPKTSPKSAGKRKGAPASAKSAAKRKRT